MGPSRIDVFDDCKATTLTTKPIWLVTFFFMFFIVIVSFSPLLLQNKANVPNNAKIPIFTYKQSAKGSVQSISLLAKIHNTYFRQLHKYIFVWLAGWLAGWGKAHFVVRAQISTRVDCLSWK